MSWIEVLESQSGEPLRTDPSLFYIRQFCPFGYALKIETLYLYALVIAKITNITSRLDYSKAELQFS